MGHPAPCCTPEQNTVTWPKLEDFFSPSKSQDHGEDPRNLETGHSPDEMMISQA